MKILEWGSDTVVSSFANKGCEYVRSVKQQPDQFSITLLTQPKIINAPLACIFILG
jgi:hypothetical protein